MAKPKYVEVEPLAPPFQLPEVVSLNFVGQDKALAVSKADYEQICELLGSDPTGREIILSPSETSGLVRISPVEN